MTSLNELAEELNAEMRAEWLSARDEDGVDE